MKKTCLCAFLCVSFLSLVSCSTDDEVFEKKSDVSLSGEIITQEEAVETAKDVLMQIKESTRGDVPEVDFVEYIGSVTRSEFDSGQAGYYLVNFDNNGGFVLLGADRRMKSLYAFSDQGSLSIADTAANPGLRMFFESLPKRIVESRASEPPTVDRPKLNVDVRVKPMLNSFVSNWDQITYNKYVRQYCNNDPKTPVGCAVVSTAQILSFYEYPQTMTVGSGSSKQTYSFDWNVIKNNLSGASDQIARLFQVLGDPYYLNAGYSVGSSGTVVYFSSVASRTYYRLGYSMPQSLGSFDKSVAVNMLKQKNLIQLTGNSDAPNSSHCWVVDGYATRTRSSISVGDAITTDFYFHFVWGNTNKCNGYYYYDESSESFGSSSSSWEDNEPGGKLGQAYKNLNMFYGFSIR